MPHEHVFDAIERLHADLLEVHEILSGDNASVRLVLTPEAVVVAEARRSMTTLSLYGYRVDGVLANRIFPSAGADAWRRQWVAAQSSILEEVRQSFAPMPIWHSPYRSCEPVGVAELAAFAAEVYGEDDPFEPPSGQSPVRIERDGDAEEVRLHWDLPFAARDEVDLARHGDELVVTVGSYRRVLAMPAALRRCQVSGAGLQDGALVVRFREAEDAMSTQEEGAR